MLPLAVRATLEATNATAQINAVIFLVDLDFRSTVRAPLLKTPTTDHDRAERRNTSCVACQSRCGVSFGAVSLGYGTSRFFAP